MELLQGFTMPKTATKTSKGSKFFTNEMKALCNSMKVGEAYIVPFLGGDVTANIQRRDTRWHINKAFDATVKNFIVGVIEPTAEIPAEGENELIPATLGGIAVQRMADTIVEPAKVVVIDTTKEEEEAKDEVAAKEAELVIE